MTNVILATALRGVSSHTGSNAQLERANGSDTVHSWLTLEQIVVCKARPIIWWRRLSVLQCWRQPRVWPEQRPRPPGFSQGGSDPLWYPAHHVLRLNSWAHQRSTCSSFLCFSFPNPLPVSVLVVSLHSILFSESAPERLLEGENLLPADAQQVFALRNNQPTNNQPAFPLELPSKPAIQCCETSEVFPVHKRRQKYKLSHYFPYVLFECLHSCVCEIHWAREWSDTRRVCQRSSLALPAKQDSYLLLPQSPCGQILSQGLGFIGWWEGNSTRTEMEGHPPFENESYIYLYTYIFFLLMSVLPFLLCRLLQLRWPGCHARDYFKVGDET